MGNDAHSTIIYGFPFNGEDFDPPDGFDEDADKWLATFQGLSEPEGDYETNKSAWKKYWEDKRNLPIDIAWEGDLCSGHTVEYLSIKEAEISGSWDRGKKIPIGYIKTPPPEWNVLLKEFCERAGIPFEQPEWYMVSSYG